MDKLLQQFYPEQEKAENRILYLEYLKILAAFLTVFYHFAYYKLNYGFIEGIAYYPNFNRIIMSLAACCVPLFFLVNGALMLKQERSWKTVYSKAVKILILTVIWSFIGFPAWFFETLTVLYILFPLFQFFYRKHRRLYELLCIVVLIFPFLINLVFLILRVYKVEYTISAMGYSIPIDSFHTTGLFTMYSILYFLLGPVLLNWKKNTTVLGIVLAPVGWIMVIVECTIYTNLNQAMYDGVNAAFPTVGALLLSTGIFLLVKNVDFEKNRKPLIWMGSAMLPIYLIHMSVIRGVKALVGPFELNMIAAILGTAVICIVSALIGKLLQRIPGLCWLVKM